MHEGLVHQNLWVVQVSMCKKMFDTWSTEKLKQSVINKTYSIKLCLNPTNKKDAYFSEATEYLQVMVNVTVIQNETSITF